VGPYSVNKNVTLYQTLISSHVFNEEVKMKIFQNEYYFIEYYKVHKIQNPIGPSVNYHPYNPSEMSFAVP